MDYPKSLPDVYLHGGKFTDGTADGSIPPSRDPAKTANDLIDSILLVQDWTGEAPNEADLTQLKRGIDARISEKISAALGGLVIPTIPPIPADIPFWAGFTSGGVGRDLAVQRYGAIRIGRARKVTGLATELGLAPTGAPVILDHRVNGTSIWTVKPQFAAGSTMLTPGTINPAMMVIAANSTVEHWVTGVGSIIRGQMLTSTLICEYA